MSRKGVQAYVRQRCLLQVYFFERIKTPGLRISRSISDPPPPLPKRSLSGIRRLRETRLSSRQARGHLGFDAGSSAQFCFPARIFRSFGSLPEPGWRGPAAWAAPAGPGREPGASLCPLRALGEAPSPGTGPRCPPAGSGDAAVLRAAAMAHPASLAPTPPQLGEGRLHTGQRLADRGGPRDEPHPHPHPLHAPRPRRVPQPRGGARALGAPRLGAQVGTLTCGGEQTGGPRALGAGEARSPTRVCPRAPQKGVWEPGPRAWWGGGAPVHLCRVTSRLQISSDNHPCRDRRSAPFPPFSLPVPSSCRKGHLPNEKGGKKLFSVPSLQSWDREVVLKNSCTH